MLVHRPTVALDARGQIATHGPMRPDAGIWHDTECGDASGITELQGVVNFWKNQGLGYGAHLIIDKDANTALCADPTQITWHTELSNTGKIGVELIGFSSFTGKMWWLRRKQLDELAKWIAYFNLEYGIPIRFLVGSGWAGHRDYTQKFHLSSGHMDPGFFFPRGYVLRKAGIYRKNGW